LTNAERFARLFQGYSKRYGRYDITGSVEPGEKVAGRARTADEAITQEVYTSHVEGRVGIGVIPLKEDDRVNFAAIDIDVYGQAEKEQKKLTHEDVALALFDTPLILTRSKSGGIHVWLFSAEGVSAKLAANYLKSHAAMLGVSSSEIFPKQTERHSEGDTGNWINLPYFGDTRRAVVPNRKGSVYEFLEIEFEQFLDLAEAQAALVTDDYLRENTNPGAKDQRADGDQTALFKDGPPCLQTLCSDRPEQRERIEKEFREGVINEDQYRKKMELTYPQLREGARDVTFFNVALYLRRRMSKNDADANVDATHLYAKLSEAQGHWGMLLHGSDWDSETKGLGDAAMQRLANQGAKGKWGYQCTKDPLKSFCNRKLCLKRRFGVGTGQNDESEISGFTIVQSKDKQYYLNVNGKRVHIPDVETLYSQSAFARKVINDTDEMWPTMQEQKFRDMIGRLLAKADTVEPAPGTDLRSDLLNLLYDFVTNKGIEKGKNDAGIHAGRALRVDTPDGTYFEFKLGSFTDLVRANGINVQKSIISDILRSDFGVKVGKNTHRGNKQIEPYIVWLQDLESLMAVEREDTDEDGED